MTVIRPLPFGFSFTRATAALRRPRPQWNAFGSLIYGGDTEKNRASVVENQKFRALDARLSRRWNGDGLGVSIASFHAVLCYADDVWADEVDVVDNPASWQEFGLGISVEAVELEEVEDGIFHEKDMVRGKRLELSRLVSTTTSR